MRIFVDTASVDDIEEWDAHPWVDGFTTNPTLFRKVGAKDPWKHAKKIVSATEKPISIDGPAEVLDLGPNVWRKVVEPSGAPRMNYTAVCTISQAAVSLHPTSIISVFAGRIMDTGRDPTSVFVKARESGGQVLWASVREPYNICQAELIGCDIVTVPPHILAKYLDWRGKPLELVARETREQFEADATW